MASGNVSAKPMSSEGRAGNARSNVGSGSAGRGGSAGIANGSVSAKPTSIDGSAGNARTSVSEGSAGNGGSGGMGNGKLHNGKLR